MKEDDIDKRIERVAESVGLKKAAMRQWEAKKVSDELKRKVAAKRWRTYGISAVASIVLICGIGLRFFINIGGDNDYGATSSAPIDRGDNDYGVTSSAPIYRGGSCDISVIQFMIDSSHYEEALKAIDVTMVDTVVIEPSFTSERQNYLRSLNADRKYELIWLKVNALVKSGRKTEAIPLLEEYVKVEKGHQKEAQTLLNDLSE